MRDNQSCCFCNIAAGRTKFGLADTAFASTDNFVAIPSIGAFIEGWSLIIPKRHDLSLHETYSNEEFQKFVLNTQSLIESKYGKTIIFEHGARVDDSQTGCGVDHAHLHIVPSQSIKDEIYASGLDWIKVHPTEISSLVQRNEYLFYADSLASGYLHILDSPRSQFFRRILAKTVGEDERFDYKSFHFQASSDRTFTTLSAI